jgi:multidrug efflux system membrane fusion protein
MTSEGVPGVQLRGRISRISPTADPKSRLFDVETTIPNESGRLKVGMVVSLQVGDEGSGSSILVPLSAVVRSIRSPDSYAVFVVEERQGNPITRMREVKLGQVFGNSIEAAAGLTAGDQVVVAGATIVTDGESVRVMP